MSSRNPIASVAAVGALALVAACSSTPMRNDRIADAPRASSPAYGDSGRVTSIE